MGAREDQILSVAPGQVVEFVNQNARFTEKIPVREVLVDGLGIGDVGNMVLRDRHVLSKDGIVVVLIQFDKNVGRLVDKPDLISRGFVFEEKFGRVLDDASRDLVKELSKKKTLDTNVIRNTAIDFLERYFAQKTGRRPMILPLVVEI
jgi:ribonuclease J